MRAIFPDNEWKLLEWGEPLTGVIFNGQRPCKIIVLLSEIISETNTIGVSYLKHLLLATQDIKNNRYGTIEIIVDGERYKEREEQIWNKEPHS